MKTQHEIEKMKDGIRNQIAWFDDELSREDEIGDRYKSLHWSRIQWVAQYNILLEVLK